MEQITPAGLKVAEELAQRNGFSQEAVVHMMAAMLRGRGGMAQFNHPEFAGSGQWMQGGMMMIGDMFNHSLKARVDGLCQAIAAVLATQPELLPVGSFQSQVQSGGAGWQGTATQQSSGGTMPTMAPIGSGSGPLFVPDPRDTWWPRDLGTPTATGAQNDVRYAVFGDSGRLAVEVNGQVSVYDTGEHRIGGVSQQQGPGGVVMFSTPAGTVSLAGLAAVSGNQQQSSSGGGMQQQSSSGMKPMSFSFAGMAPMQPMQPMQPMVFDAMAQESWWPAELGSPDASGAQNGLRYASFAASGVLAVEVDGKVSVHDARGLRIGGVSRGGDGAEVLVATPEGVVGLSSLPLLSPAEPETGADPDGMAPVAAEVPKQGPAAETDVLSALERLGELREKGILTEAEFTAKKTELLGRL
jgi:hypothetical protein